jgi:hypothetical protein
MVNIILVGSGCDFGRFFLVDNKKPIKWRKIVNGWLSMISYEFNVKVKMNFIFEQMVYSSGS